MKKFLLIFLITVNFSAYSQQLVQVTFSGASTLSSFSFMGDQNVLIKVSDDGRIIDWGLEWDAWRSDYRPGRLKEFLGRVDYYGAEADTIFRGKLKSIGTTYFTYYGSFDIAEKKGKLRTIGTTLIDYYNNYENEILKGKIKFAGNINLEYYNSFDNEAIRGKLKAVGSNRITYYTTFDEKYKVGKIKYLGHLFYTWTDSRGFSGTWQSIPMAPVINGITYIIM